MRAPVLTMNRCVTSTWFTFKFLARSSDRIFRTSTQFFSRDIRSSVGSITSRKPYESKIPQRYPAAAGSSSAPSLPPLSTRYPADFTAQLDTTRDWFQAHSHHIIRQQARLLRQARHKKEVRQHCGGEKQRRHLAWPRAST